MRRLFPILLATAALFSPITTLSAPKAAEQAASRPQKAQGLWIDVRTPAEFAQGHLQGTVNIPVEDIGKRISRIRPSKDSAIHLYCRSGRRAESARQLLLQMGYTNVQNHGGYQDLLNQGLR